MTPEERFYSEYFVLNSISADRRVVVRKALERLRAFAGVPLEQVTDDQLRGFLSELVSQGLHVNTVRKYNHACKPFFRWAWERGIVDADRYMRIQAVKNPRGSTSRALPRPYKRAEIAQFWTDLETAWPLAPPTRLRRWEKGVAKYRRVWRHAMRLQITAAGSLALYGGLRRSEIYNLSIDDMHPDNEYIVVRGKTVVHNVEKLREVPYTEAGREATAAWLEFRELLAPPHDRPWLILDPRATPNSALLPSSPLAPVSLDRFTRLLGPGWEFHRMRHTAATEWARAGVPIERVSRLLGHSSIQQTMGYYELLKDDVAASMRRFETNFMTAVGKEAA